MPPSFRRVSVVPALRDEGHGRAATTVAEQGSSRPERETGPVDRRLVALRALRVANPLVRGLLRSPAHGLLSGSLLVLSYRGRRSGRLFSIPVQYASEEGAFLVVAAMAESKQWWRTFRQPAPAELTLRRERIPVTGALVAGPAETRAALAAYAAARPRAARALGDLDRAAERAAVVRFTPTPRYRR